jgi:hypothetical protein
MLKGIEHGSRDTGSAMFTRGNSFVKIKYLGGIREFLPRTGELSATIMPCKYLVGDYGAFIDFTVCCKFVRRFMIIDLCMI